MVFCFSCVANCRTSPTYWLLNIFQHPPLPPPELIKIVQSNFDVDRFCLAPYNSEHLFHFWATLFIYSKRLFQKWHFLYILPFKITEQKGLLQARFSLCILAFCGESILKWMSRWLSSGVSCIENERDIFISTHLDFLRPSYWYFIVQSNWNYSLEISSQWKWVYLFTHIAYIRE